ncbi:MOSC domain-containing protein [Streptomyces sp. N35]|uniref:MOSC domain-containing protein n=1 Tax=Streptomyces sp. N35 TaxID=2795730 RepID=UPI0018F4C846|nr:MOSC N-terminal beta barrel domain-containing protein [Streptomyces sp. N35]
MPTATSLPVPLHRILVPRWRAGGASAPPSAVVEPWGLAGDRRWLLVDSDGRLVTQRGQRHLALVEPELTTHGVTFTAPGRAALPVTVPESDETVTVGVWQDKIEAVLADDEAHAWFSDYLQTDVRLVHLDDPATRRPIDPEYAEPGETVSFADGYPLLLTTLASLDALNSLIAQGDHADEGPLPMNRFRPNVVIAGTAPWAEDDFRRVAIGEAVFRVVKPCGRCVVTTTNQTTAERGKEPLRTLARHRRFDDQLVFGQNLIPETTGTIRVGDAVRVLG